MHNPESKDEVPASAMTAKEQANTEQATPEKAISEQASAQQTPPVMGLKQMPKRLIALMLLYVIASVSGLIAKQGVLFCLLTLLMVLGVFARQKSALWFLRGYALVQLVAVSALPFIMAPGENMATGPNKLNLGGLSFEASDYLIYTVVIALFALQVVLVFTPKVGRFFTRAPSFNLIR